MRVFCLRMLLVFGLGLWGQGQKAVAQSIENIRIESDYRKVRLTYDLLQGNGNGSPLDVSVVFRSESGRTIVPAKVSGDYLQVLPGRDKQIEWDAYAELGDFSGVLYAEFSLIVKKLECGQAIARDIDGNTYQTVKIGNQCWTQSNLKVSKYRNGDNIPTGLSNAVWQNTTSGAYAIYNNDPVNDGLYGKLYNHYAVTDSRGLCPTGWHVPSDEEWTTLENFLGGSEVAGGKLKSTAMQPTPGGWNSPNVGATNSSGFTAPPGGLRYSSGDFNLMTVNGCWWSSSVSSASSAWNRTLYYGTSNISRFNNGRTFGFSVRCCRD
ncbi:MAG: hypothetical protein KGQ39_07010 [Bacteroidetes bacterium]|nr:hypothetical protein [Bacteroidota bacterium]